MYEIEMFQVHQNISESMVEKIARSLMRANNTVWKISHLSPGTDYIFHIRAGTAGGFGPTVIVHKRSAGRLTYHAYNAPWKFLISRGRLYQKRLA